MNFMGKALEEVQSKLVEFQDQTAKKDAASAQLMMQVCGGFKINKTL
jgi:hypothetical protein